ncbi:PspC domain-containing protein [Nocardioides sp.]|uniref:ATP-binding protein n=1 Tax=Nocardioides sp. TaxID=35761 RepID=UPI002ED5A627
MSSTSAPGAPLHSVPPTVRRAFRDTQEPIIGGVASGLAHHLGVPRTWVRAAFVVSCVFGGLGVFMYAGLWLVLPGESAFHAAAPGIEGATRGGRRPGRIRRLTDLGPAIVLAALGVGAVLLIGSVLGQGTLFFAIAIGFAGVALLWRQADEAQRERWLDSTGRVDPVRVVLGNRGWASYARIGIGLLLIVLALVLTSLREGGSLDFARDVTATALLAVLGLGVVVGPWIYRLAADLTAERAERVRSQDRADVAAHLHDSVLQTLALIQKNSHDGPLVHRLARSQERDLRAWLYSEESTDETTVAGALRRMAATIEDAHGISVEVVAVGDLPYSESLSAIVKAAGEAVTNAAKHAGVERVDVFAEITGTSVDVFVRDRGVGFDPDTVAEGRFGVQHSIHDRMDRHGGTSEIRSTPGEGTEVRLHLPVTTGDSDDQ